MTVTQKAVLLNTIVFPGAGHFALKRKMIGIIYAGISIVALGIIFIKFIDLAQIIVSKLNDNITTGENLSLLGILGKSFADSNTGMINIAFVVYIAVWIVAIVDAYFIGKRLEWA